MSESSQTLDIREILRYLPHRYPFLMLDRVLAFEAGRSLLGIKNVSINEPFFQGHFPQRPIMPGVMIIEALAQATGILAFKSDAAGDGRDTLFYLVGIDKARFKQPVEPGDQLLLDVRMHRIRRGIGQFTGEARVGERVVAAAELMCAKRGVDV
ncbi:MAG: 3-hydroxyacyl-ACP dehydratase FabZ [Candidatus Competibacterales bacterium]|nr:3-hydroxyacyl-ACP dehydratase FabZ [Candidatus Competibacterales bacterium]